MQLIRSIDEIDDVISLMNGQQNILNRTESNACSLILEMPYPLSCAQMRLSLLIQYHAMNGHSPKP